MIPAPSPAAASSGAALMREPARDTLAPSSFGVLGGAKAMAPAPVRNARGALPTLGDLEGATATATLRPPGAVPPPPRALPMPTSTLDGRGLERGSPLDTPVPKDPDQPFAALAGDLRPSPRTAGALPSASGNATVVSAPAAAAVPAPGLYIADEPLEPRPKQGSLVSVQRHVLTRMRVVVLVLAGLLLMLAGALVVLIARRPDGAAARAAAPSASIAPAPLGCRLAQPPSRISPKIERTVPISAVPTGDGSIALAIADSKTSAAGWIYDATSGEATRPLLAPMGNGDVSYVSAAEPIVVDRAGTDFAFGRTLAAGLALGVGPAGILRRGADGASGVIWPVAAGLKVTPPRVVELEGGYFVAFRQGGAEGQLMTGWLKRDGSAQGELTAISGAPKTLGTPNVALVGKSAVTLFAARDDKSAPYRVHAARADFGQRPFPARALELPAEGIGAIAPSLSALPDGRLLVQYTDGNVGQYQVHTRMLGPDFQPLGEALRISAKGANAGQGTMVVTRGAAVSFFIQTTAGHDELWGASLSCR
jgi:hypothetical protein